MASDPKEMKYRRRGRVPEPVQYGQCSDRSGALDWGALKQDPLELLRKLDEIRDQITRSCELTGQPPERHRMSRRTVSLRPSHAEPPPHAGRGPEYYRSRYAGRYRTSLLQPSPYDQLQRSVSDETYTRQSSGRFRQYPDGRRENYGFGQGSRHHSTCQCAQCLPVQRVVAPEENIPMARYFAGQQGSFRFDRSQPFSSELDRRSVASSLYSDPSMSKRRVEYFRKKAENFCRPLRGAAPFVVCSSCSHLLQMPQGKFTGCKKNQVQCGSCSEIINLKPKEAKVHPVIPQSSFPVPKSVRSSNHRDPKSSGWYQHQDDDNFNFYKLQAHDSHRQKEDFSDNMSPSSTGSYDRTDSERGSSRSIQLKSVPASRSRFSNDPKDILCQGDTGSPQGPILEDKQIDPFSSQRKDYSGGDQIRRKEYDINNKADYEANGGDESLGRKCTEKSKEGHRGVLGDECSNRRTHELKGKHGNVGSPEDRIVGNKYKQKTSNAVTSSLEDEGMSIKYERNGSFRVQSISKRYEKCNKKDDSNTLEVESITKRYEQENIKGDSGKLLHSDNINGDTPAKNNSLVNECTNSSSRVSSEAEVDEMQSSIGKNGDSSFFTGFLKKGFKDLSLFNQSADSAKVSINGHPISERALRKAEKKAGPVGPGSYWYDYRAGFWGVFGQECRGIIPPFIKEFNYPMPKNCAGGNTGVFVNGRELHQKDFDLLVGRGLPRISGKSYSVEISGTVVDDTTGMKLRGLGKLAPTIEKMKRGFGMHIPEETS
ncbi:hypothetical protein SEVIR_3G130400v4 [Setaria viridis]|uniref:Probable zinc-ribbon domain-containing protein n=2 Tax=Setaria TaxID=4554 RepID=K3Z411_SETIT|nr:uncharacterized protein LOC101780239 [Setaria italica]XP_034587313.1 uncharacterized protein LOC117849754 [Setaria viridis]RCV16312.1 hypothetical protein SETIT_3G128000v2 [Setaria italica]TKW25618.1 hypothetical protein SEVIR_3G130400v2 [Setaria viridis]